jgi:hypothetical protein
MVSERQIHILHFDSFIDHIDLKMHADEGKRSAFPCFQPLLTG